ncbi:MAG TPA: hypothetical protein VNZ52_10530 [Candidatus Thermoplasmatota archaeon]|nr:hypothetical protein [Candidatus Thermoplasmatota archaeon]
MREPTPMERLEYETPDPVQEGSQEGPPPRLRLLGGLGLGGLAAGLAAIVAALLLVGVPSGYLAGLLPWSTEAGEAQGTDAPDLPSMSLDAAPEDALLRGVPQAEAMTALGTGPRATALMRDQSLFDASPRLLPLLTDLDFPTLRFSSGDIDGGAPQPQDGGLLATPSALPSESPVAAPAAAPVPVSAPGALPALVSPTLPSAPLTEALPIREDTPVIPAPGEVVLPDGSEPPAVEVDAGAGATPDGVSGSIDVGAEAPIVGPGTGSVDAGVTPAAPGATLEAEVATEPATLGADATLDVAPTEGTGEGTIGIEAETPLGETGLDAGLEATGPDLGDLDTGGLDAPEIDMGGLDGGALDAAGGLAPSHPVEALG